MHSLTQGTVRHTLIVTQLPRGHRRDHRCPGTPHTRFSSHYVSNRNTVATCPSRVDPTHAEFFTVCLTQAVQQVHMSCPGILDNVVVGAEDVPTMPDWTEGRVPLSSAVDDSEHSPAKIVIYRRPLELRTASRRGLAILVHRTLVEQLSALTGTPVETIDPSIDD